MVLRAKTALNVDKQRGRSASVPRERACLGQLRSVGICPTPDLEKLIRGALSLYRVSSRSRGSGQTQQRHWTSRQTLEHFAILDDRSGWLPQTGERFCIELSRGFRRIWPRDRFWPR